MTELSQEAAIREWLKWNAKIGKETSSVGYINEVGGAFLKRCKLAWRGAYVVHQRVGCSMQEAILEVPILDLESQGGENK